MNYCIIAIRGVWMDPNFKFLFVVVVWWDQYFELLLKYSVVYNLPLIHQRLDMTRHQWSQYDAPLIAMCFLMRKRLKNIVRFLKLSV